jgi:hypothetical protein
MNEQAIAHAANGNRVVLVKGKQRQNDEHHHKVNTRTKAESTDEWILSHKSQLAAQRVVERSEDERDNDVQQDT